MIIMEFSRRKSNNYRHTETDTNIGVKDTKGTQSTPGTKFWTDPHFYKWPCRDYSQVISVVHTRLKMMRNNDDNVALLVWRRSDRDQNLRTDSLTGRKTWAKSCAVTQATGKYLKSDNMRHRDEAAQLKLRMKNSEADMPPEVTSYQHKT